ncbi:MAG TPA: hypothetical protein VKQ32_15455 [Polyangia bacterium]|nr:hypothetical protein [Polyangia bacterium]
MDAEHYAPQIAALVAEHGEVPPPWAYYPRIHPYSIHWRMGGGEDYRYLFWTWAASRNWSLDDRIAYVRRWDPPFSWLDWVGEFLWPDAFSDDDEHEPSVDPFEEMEALGFGTRADWSRCSDVDPDKYPLADDVSSRWLESKPA